MSIRAGRTILTTEKVADDFLAVAKLAVRRGMVEIPGSARSRPAGRLPNRITS